ncbi:outer membrane protein assembly complex, YaeT protein [Salinisphaera sp. PC39]|uniref:outer membrane protein assembly factor BamA n=1 Tax=Salinisphaera sp. PC39 TaxID=1304156 RepID=UPI00334253DA
MRALGATLCLFFAVSAWGLDTFRVQDIEVEGLQRLERGTVLTYLPLSTGDVLDAQRSQQAIRALYDTGLFEDVTLAREGDTLVVRVTERPEIATFTIEGNKQIGGEELKKSLAEQGLAEGELYKRALLDQLELELRRQYYANGFYGVQIETEVTELEGNRVDIAITVDEGRVATIRDINIVGNEDFTDEELLDVFSLETSQPLYKDPAFWRKNDRYSREKMLGDLETLNSFYQDRGYLRFNVTSIQVSLSPDKRDIYLTVNIEEGEPYTISEYSFAGELIVPEANLRRLVSVREGEIFSRSQVEATSTRISSGLADFGYAFAEVDPLTQLDEENKTVDLTFFVEPGRRAYVRRVNFSGNEKTNDVTLRREMRQFEGASFSRSSVERSRTRLARLPFIEDVQVETEPVPGSEDLVDVNYSVSERPAGTLQFGVGFSDAQGFLINGSVTHSNFRGTGNRVSLRAETNDFARTLSGSWTDPYATDEGVSRTVSLFYRDTEQLIRFGSGFDLNSLGGSWTYGLPLTEYTTLRAGVGAQRNEITSVGFLSGQVVEFINRNGREFFTYEFRTGISRDTRNRTFFATRGTLTELNFDFKLPGSDLEYYVANFRHERYFNIGRWSDWLSDKFVLESQLRIADAALYGSGTDVPPYDNFFAGGARSVRGFEDGSLGPRDTFDNPYGGQFLTTLQNELVIPTFLESDNKSTRLALFYDIGNVFSGADRFEASELRKSGGVAFYWFTPFFGLLRVSYAAVVDDQPGDEVDRFQFSFGVGL